MRPEHKSQGDPCAKCGQDIRNHRNRADYHRRREQLRPARDRTGRIQVKPQRRDRIIGVDGEGQGRGPHRYTFLGASDEEGKTWGIEDGSGLSTIACLDFFLGLPDRSLIFGYALGYDWTKILADLSDEKLYSLYHESTRIMMVDGRIQYRPVKYFGYKINYMNKRVSIRKGNRSVTVWDIFRFFQGKFTQSLVDWKIGTPEKVKLIGDMKDKRSDFDKLNKKDVQAYCLEECLHLAQLGRALLDAHDDAELPLKNFFGAGSTASAFLTKISVKGKRGEQPPEMTIPVASAFFGGRFENSVCGPIPGPVYNYDISSAYPYQTTFLPCLNCGTWEHVVTGRSLLGKIKEARLALVKWRLPVTQYQTSDAWGPFPVRHESGTIAFPMAAQGGWVWAQEFLAGKRHFPHVESEEAWLYHTDCDHAPFRDIPQYYLERLRIGKEGKGIVLKLGMNSIYGKLAQSLGLNPPFQSWVWAGNITSGCRAQLLDAMAIEDRWHILMFATDGIWSDVPLTLPAPKDTATSVSGKPLGGWECKTFGSGVFAVRPGIYFPLNPTSEQLKEVRARGLGKKTLYEQWSRIIEAWDKGADHLEITGMTRFMGAKSCISYGEKSGYKRSPNYGEWIPHTIDVSFSPMPKREKVIGNRLKTWDYFSWESVPYSAASSSPDALAIKEAQQIAEEQPDVDFEYDDG